MEEQAPPLPWHQGRGVGGSSGAGPQASAYCENKCPQTWAEPNAYLLTGKQPMGEEFWHLALPLGAASKLQGDLGPAPPLSGPQFPRSNT